MQGAEARTARRRGGGVTGIAIAGAVVLLLQASILFVPYAGPAGGQPAPSGVARPPAVAPARPPALTLLTDSSESPRMASFSTGVQPQATSGGTTVLSGWDGLHVGVNGAFTIQVTPPDPQVAAGPNHVVEMVNNLVEMWTKGGTSVSLGTLAGFFQVSSSDFISDPKIQFDAPSGRWFATLTDVTTSSVRLAVSSSSDPTGSWTVRSLSASGCLDQPILGVSGSLVLVSVNVFSACSTGGSFVGAEYWAVSKANLVAGTKPAVQAFGPFAQFGSIHPAQVLGGASGGVMVSVNWTVGSSADSIQIFTVTGTPPNVAVAEQDLPIRMVSVAPSAPQQGTFGDIDTGDLRVLDAFVSGDALWFGLDTGCLPVGDFTMRACARLTEVSLSAGTVLQDFDVAASGKYYFYPALRPDPSGNLTFVFGSSSSTDYPSLQVSGLLTSAAAGAYFAPTVARQGSGPVVNGACTTCRYGDYFGAGIDPSTPSTIWLAGEFGTSSGWSTRVFGATTGASSGSPPPPPSGLSASFTYSPASPTVGQAVSFTASATGGTPPYSFAWQFGDGSTGTGSPVSHAYAAAGSYSVTLTTTDSASASTTTSQTVTVSAAAPPPSTVTLTITAGTGGSVYYIVGATIASVAAGTTATISVTPGTIVTLDAFPAPFYLFQSWSGSVSSTMLSIIVTVTTNMSVTANFVPFGLFSPAPAAAAAPSAGWEAME